MLGRYIEPNKMLQWQSLSECRSTYPALLYGQVQCRMQGPVCAEADPPVSSENLDARKG